MGHHEQTIGDSSLFLKIQSFISSYELFYDIMIVITHFWVTPKFIFLFFKKKNKQTARCFFERHGAASSPLQMQRQGRRGFLKIFFPLTFSPSHLHKTLPKPIPTQQYPAKKGAPCPVNSRPPYPAEVR